MRLVTLWSVAARLEGASRRGSQPAKNTPAVLSLYSQALSQPAQRCTLWLYIHTVNYLSSYSSMQTAIAMHINCRYYSISRLLLKPVCVSKMLVKCSPLISAMFYDILYFPFLHHRSVSIKRAICDYKTPLRLNNPHNMLITLDKSFLLKINMIFKLSQSMSRNWMCW